MNRKKQGHKISGRVLELRGQRLQQIREALNVAVPKLIREVKASGKNNQTGFERELNEHVKSGSAVQTLLAKAADLWVDDKTDECNVQSVYVIAQTLAVLSFAPGGTTAVIGTKFMGLEFDAEDFK